MRIKINTMMKEQTPGFLNTLYFVERALYDATMKLKQFDIALEMGYISLDRPKDLKAYEQASYRVNNLAMIARLDICLN